MSSNWKSHSGIVLFKTRSPFSDFASAVSGHPFSHAGFFYRTSITGQTHHAVIAMDLFGLKKPKPGNSSYLTLESLQKDPSVSSLAVRYLEPIHSNGPNGHINIAESNDRQTQFLMTISDLHFQPASPEETVADVFGMKLASGSEDRKTPIQLTNYVITQMLDSGAVSSSSSTEKTSPNLPDVLEDNEMGRLQLLVLMGTHFSRSNQAPGIERLMNEQNLFGKLTYLPLVEQNPLRIRKNLMTSSAEETEFMKRFARAFVDMLCRDRNFLSTVISGVNAQKTKGPSEIPLDLSETLKTSKQVVEELNQSLQTGILKLPEFSKLLQDHLNSIASLAETAQIPYSAPRLQIPSQNSHLVVEVNSPGESVQAELQNVVHDLKQLAKDVQANKVPNLDLTHLQNLLQKLTGQEVKIPSTNFAAYLLGKQQNLSTSHTDLILNQNTPESELKKLNTSELEDLYEFVSGQANASMFQVVLERINRILIERQ